VIPPMRWAPRNSGWSSAYRPTHSRAISIASAVFSRPSRQAARPSCAGAQGAPFKRSRDSSPSGIRGDICYTDSAMPVRRSGRLDHAVADRDLRAHLDERRGVELVIEGGRFADFDACALRSTTGSRQPRREQLSSTVSSSYIQFGFDVAELSPLRIGVTSGSGR